LLLLRLLPVGGGAVAPVGRQPRGSARAGPAQGQPGQRGRSHRGRPRPPLRPRALKRPPTGEGRAPANLTFWHVPPLLVALAAPAAFVYPILYLSSRPDVHGPGPGDRPFQAVRGDDVRVGVNLAAEGSVRRRTPEKDGSRHHPTPQLRPRPSRLLGVQR